VVRVVRVAVTIGSRVRRDPWELLRVIALLAGIIVLPTPTQSASSSPGGSPSAASPNAVGGNALRRVPQTQVFDPAAAQLSSWWSYNAMSVIAPIIYGDFQSPLQLSFSFGSSGVAPMPESEGLDPAVSAVLDSMLEPGLLPGGGSAETAAFGVGSTGIGWSSEGLGWSGAGLGLSSAVPTNSIVGAIPIISTAEGFQPVCSNDQLERQLQAGGEFWNVQGMNAAPVQFPSGVFTGPVEVGNPLGALGPSGNPSNVAAPGPAGGWCRPAPAPFFESSPLASHSFWIPVIILFVGVVVFWLSRGMKMPVRSGMTARSSRKGWRVGARIERADPSRYWLQRSVASAPAIIAMLALMFAVSINRAPATAGKPLRWLFSGPGVVAAITADAAVSRLLDNTRPFVITGGYVPAIPPGWNAVPLVSLKSFGAIRDTLEMGRLRPQVRGVMYDYEMWRFTPEEEQRNPAGFLKQAADLVHAQGLLFLTAPAVDLVMVMAPGEDRNLRYDTYLRLGIAADAARHADVIDIQAQSAERNTELYARFVQQAAAQAREANPKVLVLAGISTQPSGQQVTADDILRAVAATRDIVDGYWFNIPRPSEYCPRCTEFRPDIAIDVLRRLLRSN